MVEIREHAVVRLLTSVEGYEAGTVGTVVYVYEGKEAVEVEFADGVVKTVTPIGEVEVVDA